MQEGPTPSQRTNELIRELAQVAAGAPAAGATALFSDRLQELDRTLTAFQEGLHAAGEPAPGTRRPAERVVVAFGEYRTALEDAEVALAEGGETALRHAGAALAEAGTELHEAMREYEWSHLTSGSSPYPLLNLLRRLRDVLEHPQGADLAQVHAWSRQLLTLTADQMRPDARLAPLVGAFERAAAALQGPEALREVGRACEQIETALMSEVAPPAPPRSWLEAVLVSARGHARGDLPAGLALEAVDALEERLVFAYQDFEAAAARAAGDWTRELHQARDRFALLNEALEELRLALQSGADPEPALGKLGEAGAGLRESQAFFEAADEAPSLRSCPRCGHGNPVGARVCTACAALLPRAAGPEATELPESGLVRSQNLLELLQACEKAATGEISGAQFEGYLRWGFELVQQAREAAAELPLGHLESEAARSLAERFQEGLDEFQTGLEELSSWVGGGGSEFYHAGTRCLLRGGQKLEALRAETC